MNNNEGTSEFSETSLIRSLKSHGAEQERTITWLHKQYYHRFIYYFRNQFGFSPEESADQTQEFFIKLITKIDGFRGESKLTTWMWSIARNQSFSFKDKARNRYLHREFEESIDVPRSSPSAEQLSNYELESFNDCMRNGLKKFNRCQSGYAQVLKFVYFDGFSIADIASHTEKSYSAAKEYLSQARKRAERYLAACYDDIRVG